MAASTISIGAKAIAAKTIAFIATPTFGVLALAGVITWQYMAGKRDEKEKEEKAKA